MCGVLWILILLIVIYVVWAISPRDVIQAITGGLDGDLSDVMRHAPPALRPLLEAAPPLTTHATYRNITLHSHAPEPHLMQVAQYVYQMADFPELPIHVYYYALDAPKVFSPDGVQTRSNVNSAICLVGRRQATIYLYREEESARLLIHELLHASLAAPAKLRAATVTYRGRACRALKLDEAWVDALATYMYATGFGVDDTLRRALEQSHRRVCTILKLCGMSFDEFMASSQSTNIREYYLVKYLILQYIARHGVDLRLPLYRDSAAVRELTLKLITGNTFEYTDVELDDLSATR